MSYEAGGQERSVTGALRAVGDGQLEVEPAEGPAVGVPFEAVRDARVVLPW